MIETPPCQTQNLRQLVSLGVSVRGFLKFWGTCAMAPRNTAFAYVARFSVLRSRRYVTRFRARLRYRGRLQLRT